MTIKKMYVEMIEILEANKDKKVRSILPEIIELAKTNRVTRLGETYIEDKNGNVVAIHCYYFKKWMPLIGDKAVEFGIKKSTKTGYNPMCKIGLNLWVKQNNKAKKAQEQLLEKLESGELTVDQISSEKEKIKKERKKIASTDMGFETKEEVENYLDSYFSKK